MTKQNGFTLVELAIALMVILSTHHGLALRQSALP